MALTSTALKLLKMLRREPGEVAELLPTREIPTNLTQELKGASLLPHEFLGAARKSAPKNVVEMLYGSNVRHLDPKMRLSGEELAAKFNAPRFALERPLFGPDVDDVIAQLERRGYVPGIIDDYNFKKFEGKYDRDELRERALDSLNRYTLNPSDEEFVNEMMMLDPAFSRYMNHEVVPRFKGMVPKWSLRNRYEDMQRSSPEANRYFERILTANDPALYQLPEKVFEGQHFDTRRPAVGHIRGSVAAGDNGLPRRVLIDELQSDLLPALQRLKFDRAYKGVGIPGTLENIYPNLAKAALQRSARMGANQFGIVTPGSASAARRFEITPAARLDEIEMNEAAKRGIDKMQRIYGDEMENKFFAPLEKEYRIRPEKYKTEDNMWFNMLTLPPDVMEDIIRRGLPGFKSGGYVINGRGLNCLGQ